MISVRIPKDIRDYKEKLFFGLTARQLLSCIIAAAVCIPLYIFGQEFIPEDLLSWVVILLAIPCGAFGFVKIHNMPFEKFAVHFIYQLFLIPVKRNYKSENDLKNWVAAAEKEDNAENTALKEKIKLQASLERAFYMEEAENKGEYIDTKNIKLISIPHKPKKPKKDKDTKQKEKNNMANEKLKQKAEAIKAKQTENSFYVFSAAERKVLTQWANKQQQLRSEQVKAQTKRISQKNNKMKKRRAAPTSIPKTTQQAIPFIADYDEGMFEVEPGVFNKMYQLQDMNYLAAHEDEQEAIFVKYRDFLNYFSEEMTISLSIDTHIVSRHEQERKVLYQLKGDEFDRHREEYNKILRRQIVAGRNDMVQMKYITVTIRSDTPIEALMRFHKIDNEVLDNLRAIGSKGRVLTTTERLSMLHDKFRKGREGDFKIDYDFIKLQGISSKDYIAPSSMSFVKSHFTIEDVYYRCLYLNNLPANLSDNFLSDIVDSNFPMIATLSIQPMAQDKALRMVQKQLTGMEANKIEAQKRASRSGYSAETINHRLKQSLEEAEKLILDLTQNDQKMFFVTVSFLVSGDTLEELNDNTDVVASKIRKFACQVQSFDNLQEKGFQVTLPGGLPPGGRVMVDRALTSESTAIFIPFSAQELYQPGGFYYGLNQISHNLILCDRTSMKTPSGFILGSSGSGKSFATKREALNVLLNDDKTSLLIIDPENEYGDFARAFGGAVINISTDSDSFINPMDMSEDYGLDENDDNAIDIERKKSKAIQKKSDYIMSIIECMLSVNGEVVITPQQKTIVDRCVRACYKKYLENDFDQRYLPTFEQLQMYLDAEKVISEDARQIAEGVEYYTRGSMNVFSHLSNVDYNNRTVVFNVRDLGTQLKQIALLIVLDFIWNRMIQNFDAGVRTYCYVDEIHVLFQNEYSARFLQQLYKRGRKYGLVITGITQDVQDLLKSEMALGMISNSDFIMMLNQAPENLRVLAPMLNISDTQMQFVTRADAGSGLLFAERVIVPFSDKFPSDSYLYKLMSTKFGETTNAEKEIKKIMGTTAN